MGAPIGLDFAAVAAVSTAMAGSMSPLLAEILPDMEAAIVAGLKGEGELIDGEG
jgi:hypothetical protein